MRTEQNILQSHRPLLRSPALPAIVRYYDDFAEVYRVIHAPADIWTIEYDGRTDGLDFSIWPLDLRELLKAWCADYLAQHSPRSLALRVWALRGVDPDLVRDLLTAAPNEIRRLWTGVRALPLGLYELEFLKLLLSFACSKRIGQWTPGWSTLVAKLPVPSRDKGASIRKGDVFLSIEEEEKLVRFLDDVAASAKTMPGNIPPETLLFAAILICSFQYAMRPKQIAMVRIRDVRIWDDGLDSSPAVHVTFTMIKQRPHKRGYKLVRRIKREWAIIFVETLSRACEHRLGSADHLFELTPSALGQLIVRELKLLLSKHRTAGHLRHSAAQRLADAGASEEEIASFLGQSDLRTALNYFRRSPSQAKRLNQALGISKIYTRVVQIARDRFITAAELAQLKANQQIGGVPHGIPITGIGGCSSGQPACPYNPVMSCYGCRKFMPVRNIELHKQVLADFRSIVRTFFDASRGERSNPAFVQLRRTIACVQGVIEDLTATQ